jgi:hypothetical protein
MRYDLLTVGKSCFSYLKITAFCLTILVDPQIGTLVR